MAPLDGGATAGRDKLKVPAGTADEEAPLDTPRAAQVVAPASIAVPDAQQGKGKADEETSSATKETVAQAAKAVALGKPFFVHVTKTPQDLTGSLTS